MQVFTYLWDASRKESSYSLRSRSSLVEEGKLVPVLVWMRYIQCLILLAALTSWLRSKVKLSKVISSPKPSTWSSYAVGPYMQLATDLLRRGAPSHHQALFDDIDGYIEDINGSWPSEGIASKLNVMDNSFFELVKVVGSCWVLLG